MNVHTSITGKLDGEVHVRGYKVTELMQKASFTQAIYLILRGQMPDENQEAFMNTLLVAALDHGPGPLFTQNARNSASAGASTSAAIAAGVLGIGEYNGGAVEASARLLQDGVNSTAGDIVQHAMENKKRLPGYGHPHYTGSDPRTDVILEKAEELGFLGKYLQLGKNIEQELMAQKSDALVYNIDGAIAAGILELGFSAESANAFFIIARVPGFAAHIMEERLNKPMSRRIDEGDVVYEGEKPREL